MPATRHLPDGNDPWTVLAGEQGRTDRALEDLRSTVLARLNPAAPITAPTGTFDDVTADFADFDEVTASFATFDDLTAYTP